MVHGYTPDISVFWEFKFWQPVRYFLQDTKYPMCKELPARIIGIAWEAGDMLTYYILPDDPSRKTPSVLIRSVIVPDDGTNKRCNEIREHGSEKAACLKIKKSKTRKSPRLQEKLWPEKDSKTPDTRHTRKEECKNPEKPQTEENPKPKNPQTRKEERAQPNESETRKEEQIDNKTQNARVNSENLEMGMEEQRNTKNEPATQDPKPEKLRRSPRLQAQSRKDIIPPESAKNKTRKTPRTHKLKHNTVNKQSPYYETDKNRRSMIKSQMTSKLDAITKLQKMPDIICRRAQIPKTPINTDQYIIKDPKCRRLDNLDNIIDYNQILHAMNDIYGTKDYYTELLYNRNTDPLFEIE